MSYIIQPFTPPPTKRARKTISFTSDAVSKCAEIFVTNNADQWTFYCAYCPKTASDIGVFICHIRLEHLKVQTDLTPEQTGNVSPKTIDYSLENCSNLNWMAELTTNSQLQSPPKDIAKEEENLQTSCAKFADITDNTLIKNSITKTQQDNEVFFTIIGSQETQTQLISKQVNVQNEAENEYDYKNSTNEINKGTNNDPVNDSDVDSPNEDDGDDIDFEINKDNELSGNSKNKVMKKSIAASADNSLSTFRCPYCIAVLKNKKSLRRHIYFHNKELPIRRKKCQRGFFTANSSKMHLRSHKEKNYFQCSVCKTKQLKNNFIAHVLTHESATCFPCQVCGNVYASQEERMTHWKTHAQEKPFACNICYRRYDELGYLNRHLKTHNHQCNFCPAKFNATAYERPPYVCAKCEKLPDIKQRVEYLKSLNDNNPIFDLDEDTIRTFNDNNPEAKSSIVQTGDVNDGTESHKEYECSLCSSVYNTPKTQRSPYVCGKCENLSEGLLPEITIAAVKTEDLTGEIQTNTEDITNITANIPGSYNNSNADVTDDDGLNDCNSDLEFIYDNVSSGSSKMKIMKKSIAVSEDNSLSTFKCPYCTAVFKYKSTLARHILHFHEKDLHMRCEKCQRGFLTANSLRRHLKSHEKNQIQCPVCKEKNLGNYFIAHVLTHESTTCFPCQVCGKLYVSQEERTTHWKTHAQEKPFACNICYRRYNELHYLTSHLKSHKQYNCNFCPAKFNATAYQRPPYICAKCEKLPDIKQRVEYFKSLNDNNPIFDSDEDTIGTLNSDNNSAAMTFNVPTNDVYDEVNEDTESQKQYECSLCSYVYNTPETQRSPYVCGKCKNFPQGLLSKVTIAAAKTAYLIGEIQTNTEGITNITANMPGFYNNSNANTSDDDSLNDCGSDLEFIYDNVPSGSSKNKIMKKSLAASDDNGLSFFKCPYCITVFTNKRSSAQHILHYHDKELPIRCKKCQRGFFTANSLKMHLRSHEEKNYFQCPVCKTKHMENHFITHVLTHESATCFPCQVCGKLYASQEKRMTHWETHAKEKPFACNICYRRYVKTYYLTVHLRTHNQYLCNFCPAEFQTTEAQQPPYVCGNCEKLPDIKQRVEYSKLLTDSNPPISDSGEDNFRT